MVHSNSFYLGFLIAIHIVQKLLYREKKPRPFFPSSHKNQFNTSQTPTIFEIIICVHGSNSDIRTMERDATKLAWSKVADENALVLYTIFRNVTSRINPDEKQQDVKIFLVCHHCSLKLQKVSWNMQVLPRSGARKGPEIKGHQLK